MKASEWKAIIIEMRHMLDSITAPDQLTRAEKLIILAELIRAKALRDTFEKD